MTDAATVGLATRKAATAALKAHVAVLKGTPLRHAIAQALAAAEGLGGKERRFVAFAARELSRHLRRLDLSARTRGWPPARLQLPEDQAILRYALWRRELGGASAEKVMAEVGLPGPIRPRGLPDQVLREELAREVDLELGPDAKTRAANEHSFPTWLVDRLAEIDPPGGLEALLRALNREPTLTLRARPPGSRDELVAALREQGVPAEACAEVPDALRIAGEGRAVFETRWMKEGRLLVMDLGSQRLVELCRVAPGATVVDYCAGAGGKTIALADAVGPKGRVFAWDESAKRLAEGKRRVGALGLRQVTFPHEPRVDLADLVLVDAPCSGTGTLGREPDQKWKLTSKRVQELSALQLGILETLAPRLKAGAVIVYATCSVLTEEDEAVVDRFLRSNAGFQLEQTLRTWPQEAAGGGFFGARLVKGC